MSARAAPGWHVARRGRQGTTEDDAMIMWRRFGAVHIGTTDSGLRFRVWRAKGDRFYTTVLTNAQGNEVERCEGYQSVGAAKVAALVTASGLEAMRNAARNHG